MCGKTQVLLYALLGVFWVGTPLPSWGQKKNGYPVVTYEFGKVIEGLPYGRKFYISGPLQEFGNPKADVVLLDIYPILQKKEEKQKSREENEKKGEKRSKYTFVVDTNPIYSGYYCVEEDSLNTKKFWIFIDKPLQLANQYQLHFRYFQRSDLKIGQDEISFYQSTLDSIYKADEGIGEESLQFAMDKLHQKLAEQYQFGQLRTIDHQLSFQQHEFKPITFPIKTSKGKIEADSLLELARTNQTLRENRENLLVAKEEIKKLRESPAHQKLLMELDSLQREQIVYPQKYPNLLFDQLDIQNLKKLTRNQDDLTALTSLKKKFRPLLGNNLFSTSSKNHFTSLINTFSVLERVVEDIDEDQKKVDLMEERFGAIEEILITGFQLTGKTKTLTEARIDSETELQKLKIGTTAGGSMAALNSGNINTAQIDPFSYAGFKFFFQPVDKGLPNPYVNRPGPFKRMSFLLGIQFLNDLKYRDQDLGDLLGVKPVIGFSYDVTPYLSLEMGSVFFEQKNTSPLLSETRPRVAPFFSISLDPDLVNRVDNWFSDKNYGFLPKK